MKQYFKCFFEVVSIVLVMNNIVFCQQDDCQRSAKFGDVLICLPIIEGYENIKEKYKKDYCPCSYFNQFSKSNKIKYMVLRMEIDTKLGIKDTTYKF